MFCEKRIKLEFSKKICNKAIDKYKVIFNVEKRQKNKEINKIFNNNPQKILKKYTGML